MPVVTFTSLDSVHNPAAAGVAPATWFTTIESNFRSIDGRVGCQILSSTTQDVTSVGTTTITLGTVEWNNGMTTGAVANAITVPSSYAGKYLITAALRLDTDEGGGFSTNLDVLNNGSQIWRERHAKQSGSSLLWATTIATSFVYVLAVGDDLTLSCTTTGLVNDADTIVTSSYSSLTAVWLSA